MCESNKLCILEEKANRSIKKNKANFISVTGAKFVMGLWWRKLKISFCKELLSFLNYF